MLHANTQGIQLSNQLNPQTLTTDFISEALTLSELFNLNEIAAVDLLLSGIQNLLLTKKLSQFQGIFIFIVLGIWLFLNHCIFL